MSTETATRTRAKSSRPITTDMIARTSKNTWSVESRTRGFLLAHRITWEGTRYTCTCEWSTNHPYRPCEHIKAVSLLFSPNLETQPDPPIEDECPYCGDGCGYITREFYGGKGGFKTVRCPKCNPLTDAEKHPDYQSEPDPNPEPAPEPVYIVVPRPPRQYPAPSNDTRTLEEIFDGSPPSREIVKQAKKFVRREGMRLEDLF